MNKIYSCSTVDLVLMSETILTQSPIVQYLSILDLVTLLSCYQLVLLKLYKNNIYYYENYNLHNEELNEKSIRYEWQE